MASIYRAPETACLPLAGVELCGEPVLYHVMGDYSMTPERIAPASLDIPLLIGGVTITHPQEQEVRVEFGYTARCGAPVREWASQTFLIVPGEWAQIRYNGRFAHGYADYQYYEKTVVNVGLFSELSETLFLDSKPTYRYSMISDLW